MLSAGGLAAAGNAAANPTTALATATVTLLLMTAPNGTSGRAPGSAVHAASALAREVMRIRCAVK
jgi:hypothetical protein